jgi:hypothetical protein
MPIIGILMPQVKAKSNIQSILRLHTETQAFQSSAQESTFSGDAFLTERSEWKDHLCISMESR